MVCAGRHLLRCCPSPFLFSVRVGVVVVVPPRRTSPAAPPHKLKLPPCCVLLWLLNIARRPKG